MDMLTQHVLPWILIHYPWPILDTLPVFLLGIAKIPMSNKDESTKLLIQGFPSSWEIRAPTTMHTHRYIYIYIYTDREREREKKKKTCVCVCAVHYGGRGMHHFTALIHHFGLCRLCSKRHLHMQPSSYHSFERLCSSERPET